MVAGLSLPSRGKLVEKKIGSILLHLNSSQKNTFFNQGFLNEHINHFLSQEILFLLRAVLTFRDAISLKCEMQN